MTSKEKAVRDAADKLNAAVAALRGEGGHTCSVAVAAGGEVRVTISQTGRKGAGK